MDYKLEYKPVGSGRDPETGKTNQGLNGTFFIPAYQRGYRWTRDEVRKLLDDILESDEEGRKRYSLQPIVVKRRRDDSWELIDGQQRLTTLWLIFNYMHKRGFKRNGPTFNLKYETRVDSKNYLESLGTPDTPNSRQAIENIDYFHLRAAHDAIDGWLHDNSIDEQNKEDLVDQIHRYLIKSVHVIWYEVPQTEDPIKLFTRLNQGRIPLTDAELLKAVLLTHVAKNHKGREAEIAAQWDGMERDLQRPEIWAFVAGGVQDDERYGTRISLLFDTLAQRENPHGNTSQPYFTFDTLRGQAESDGLALWSDVEKLHAQILGWFEEPRWYNKIGFLVMGCGASIGDIQKKTLESRKRDFDQWLTGEIQSKLAIKADALDEDLSYDDAKRGYPALQRLLLLFNVETETCRSARFPFERHAEQDWTLEHIHAQNAQSLNTAVEWKSWLEAHGKALEAIKTTDNADDVLHLLSDIGSAIPSVHESGFGDRFNLLAARIQKALTPDGEGEGADHTIANLALLSHEVNSALSNAAFEVKRQKILERDRAGKDYIPAATRNVFLKYYTDAGNLQSHFWGAADKTAYLQKIKDQLKPYLLQ